MQVFLDSISNHYRKTICLENISDSVVNKGITDSLQRARIITIICMFAYFIYGFVSHNFLLKYDPSITLFNNLWPRLMFNSIPCFGLLYIFKCNKLSGLSKLYLWSFAFSIIFTAACCVHVWPLALKGYPVILDVSSANFITFAMVWWLLLLPFKYLYKVMLIQTITFFIPWFIVTWHSGLKITTLNLITETLFFEVFILLSASYAAYLVLQNQESENQSKEQISKLLNQYERDNTKLNDTLSINTQLFRTVIHDTASPLMVLSESLSKLNKDTKNNYLNKAIKSCQSISSIVTEVKQLEFVQNNKKKITLSPVAVNHALTEVRNSNQDQLKKKGINLIIDNQLSSSTRCLANKNILIHSILNNLINNSCKFSKDNSNIKLSVSQSYKDIIFEVRDYGIGIPKSILSTIFDPSVPKSRVGTRGEVGSGFGLSLVKSYVDLFNGKIEIYSNPENSKPEIQSGTLVRVTLTLYNSRSKNIHEIKKSNDKSINLAL